MIWLQIFIEPLVVAMNKGCQCFSTVLKKSREEIPYFLIYLNETCTLIMPAVEGLIEK